MISKIVNKNFVFLLFKTAALFNITFLLTEALLHIILPEDHVLLLIVDKIEFFAMLCMNIIICIKGTFLFISNHKEYNKDHKYIAPIIESIVASCFLLIFIINANISDNFILFLSQISISANNSKVFLIFLLVILYLLSEILDTYKLQIDTIQDTSILQTVKSNFFYFIIKISMISLVLIGHLPMVCISFFSLSHLSEFTHSISLEIDSTVFSYLKAIIVVLLSFWILIEIYEAYKFSENK